MKYNKHGEELPDNTPVSLTVHQRQALDKYELIKRQILAAVQAAAEYEGEETFEEANDFDVEDDDVPLTPAERAEIEFSDLKRTANYVREQEYVEEGKKRFSKRNAIGEESPPLPAKQKSPEGRQEPEGRERGLPPKGD